MTAYQAHRVSNELLIDHHVLMSCEGSQAFPSVIAQYSQMQNHSDTLGETFEGYLSCFMIQYLYVNIFINVGNNFNY